MGFQVSLGLRQGCFVTPRLFNMHMNEVMREVEDMGLALREKWRGLLVGGESIHVYG